VFDGHDSARASNFASQRLPAELLLGQLSGKTTDEEVKEVLYQVIVVLYEISKEVVFICFACIGQSLCRLYIFTLLTRKHQPTILKIEQQFFI